MWGGDEDNDAEEEEDEKEEKEAKRKGSCVTVQYPLLARGVEVELVQRHVVR